MLLKDWLYVIPKGSSEYILYAPLHRKAVRITEQAAKAIVPILSGDSTSNVLQPEVWSFLKTQGLVVLPELEKKSQRRKKIFLSITNKCNLRCIYCYANTGIDNSSIPFDIAKNAVRKQLQEIVQSNGDTIAITFHGGGEALVELDLLKRIVEYVNSACTNYGVKPVLGCVTNATLVTKTLAQWLATNFSHITVSLDGSEEIQNLQRPRADGSGSYRKAMYGIENLIAEGMGLAIRATVTELSVRKMEDFVRFAKENIFPKGGNIDFEPVSLCGRAQNSTILATNPKFFLEHYIVARQTGRQIGVDVSCSMDTFGSTKEAYCGTTHASLQCYTPSGKISACTRVIKESDDGAALFFYGEAKDNEINIDSNAIQKIVTFGKSHDEICYSCFARWNCQGGCPSLRYTNREHFEQTCFVTRELLLHDLSGILDIDSSRSIEDQKEVNELIDAAQ